MQKSKHIRLDFSHFFDITLKVESINGKTYETVNIAYGKYNCEDSHNYSANSYYNRTSFPVSVIQLETYPTNSKQVSKIVNISHLLNASESTAYPSFVRAGNFNEQYANILDYGNTVLNFNCNDISKLQTILIGVLYKSFNLLYNMAKGGKENLSTSNIKNHCDSCKELQIISYLLCLM